MSRPYILTHNILGSHLYLGDAVDNDPSKFNWYLDPAKALVFNSKAEAETFSIEEINCAYSKAELLSDARIRWKNFCAGGCAMGQILRVPPTMRKPLSLSGTIKEKRARLLAWWLSEYQPHGNIPQEVYSKNSGAMYTTFKFLMVNGYWVETEQHSITIRFTEFVEAKEQPRMVEELQQAVPLLRPFKDGSVRFKILEPSTSLHDSYSLRLTKDGVWKLMADRRERVLAENKDLGVVIGAAANVFRPVMEDPD